MSITIKQAVAMAPIMYEVGRPWLLQGPPGCGKTISMTAMQGGLTQHFNEPFGLVTRFNLMTKQPATLTGYDIPTKNSEGVAVTVSTVPQLLEQIRLDGHAKGILVVDEFQKADQLTKNAFSTLLDTSARYMGTSPFPDGWWIVMLSNRRQDKSGDGKALAHITNKCAVADIEFALDDQCHVMARMGVDHRIIAWSRFAYEQGTGYVDGVPSDASMPFCTPRSTVAAAETFAAYNQAKYPGLKPDSITRIDPLCCELMSQHIGFEAAQNLKAFFSCYARLPTVTEVEADPERAVLPSVQELGACYAVMELLRAAVVKRNLEALWTYVMRLPEAFHAAFILSVLDKGDADLNILQCSPSVGKWIAANSDLLADVVL